MDRSENRIRELRQARGIGLNELARRCFVSGAYIHDIELGYRPGSRDVLERIAKELGVKVEDLKRKAG